MPIFDTSEAKLEIQIQAAAAVYQKAKEFCENYEAAGNWAYERLFAVMTFMMEVGEILEPLTKTLDLLQALGKENTDE